MRDVAPVGVLESGRIVTGMRTAGERTCGSGPANVFGVATAFHPELTYGADTTR